ncbi:Ankyrin repeat-containing protein [Colletotrichum kahawae]|uniref:Ankyrin repeat-containing protein n=1 Tax=Colletotrichum kahawae TaxID=34407 RepID=A0AAD9YBV3_COLKA|nr:Ankyrin repeat-containing protein [Colletotrichum kahawae]
MAEPLGIASSVFAVVDVATKIGVATIKLKKLWNEVKETPKMLFHKAEQLQDFEEFLIDADIQIYTSPLPTTSWNSTLLHKYIIKARVALAELQRIIDDLLEQATSGSTYRRKLGSTKAVLKKDDIKALDAKLDQALNLFKMAQGQYMISVVDVFNMSHERTLFGKLCFAFNFSDRLECSLRTSDWLSPSVYSIMLQRSTIGWQFSFRAYEVVEYFPGHELTKYAAMDDAGGLFKYLSEHRISPFVRDRRGHTLLRLAASHLSVSVLSNERQWQPQEIIKLFANHNLEEEVLGGLETFNASPHELYALIALFGDTYFTFPLEAKLQHLRCHLAASDDDFVARSSLVHTIAFYVARDFDIVHFNHEQTPLILNPWYEIVRTYIAADPEGLSHLDKSWDRQLRGEGWQTPFSTLVNGILDPRWWGPSPGRPHFDLPQAVQLWVSAVSSCDINLLKYGRGEKDLHKQGQPRFKQRKVIQCYNGYARRRERVVRVSLIGITYGFRPEQWTVCWTHEFDDYAGEFWHMIEEPKMAIPGSWVEDVGDYDDLERARIWAWEDEEPPALIWSEYRNVRPPF